MLVRLKKKMLLQEVEHNTTVLQEKSETKSVRSL